MPVFRPSWRWTFKPPPSILINPSHPHARGLTSAFFFREGSGSAVLDATGRPAGSMVGSPIWSPGRDGPAVTLDGSTQYLDAGRKADQFVTATDGTIEVWFRQTAVSTSAGASYNLPGLFFDMSGYLGLSIGILGGLDRVWAYNFDGSDDQVGVSYLANGWNRATWIHSSGVLSCYVNGVLGGSVASGSTQVLSGAIRIGRSYGGLNFGGQIGSVLSWNRALTYNEITSRHVDPYGMLQRPSKLLSFEASDDTGPPTSPIFRRTFYRRAGSRGVRS